MMTFDHGTWLFTDEFGAVWRLVPSGERDMPLRICLISYPPLRKEDES